MPDITRVNCSDGCCEIHLPNDVDGSGKQPFIPSQYNIIPAGEVKFVPMSGRTVNVNEVK